MFFRSVHLELPRPCRPGVCVIDILGFCLQLSLWLFVQPESTAVNIYFLATMNMFGASALYHCSPSHKGLTVRLDLTALYLLIIAAVLPYWNDQLAFWWFGSELPAGNQLAGMAAILVVAYMVAGYRPSKTIHIGIMLTLAVPSALHMLMVGWSVYSPEVMCLWTGSLALFVFALCLYVIRWEHAKCGLSWFAYYHILLVPAVYLQSQAALVALGYR